MCAVAQSPKSLPAEHDAAALLNWRVSPTVRLESTHHRLPYTAITIANGWANDRQLSTVWIGCASPDCQDSRSAGATAFVGRDRSTAGARAHGRRARRRRMATPGEWRAR